MKHLIFYLLVMTLSVCVSPSSTIEPVKLTYPKATAAIGEKISLQCNSSVDKPVRWLFKNNATAGSKYIELYFNNNFTNGHGTSYQLDTTVNGKFNLVIKSVGLHNQGMYLCSEENGQGVHHYIWLDVNEPRNSDEVTPSSACTRNSTPQFSYSNVADDGKEGGCVSKDVFVGVVTFLSLFVIVLVCLIIGLVIKMHRMHICVTTDVDEPSENELLLANKPDENSLLVQKLKCAQGPDDWNNDELMYALLGKPTEFAYVMKTLEKRLQTLKFDVIVGVDANDSHACVFAAPIAHRQQKPYVPILVFSEQFAGNLETVTYTSRFGKVTTIVIPTGSIHEGQNVVVVDSYILTGNSTRAAIDMVSNTLKANVVLCVVMFLVRDVKIPSVEVFPLIDLKEYRPYEHTSGNEVGSFSG